MSKIDKQTEAMLLNNATASDIYDRLMMLAISIFTWEGLDEVAGFGASRFLEQSLFRYGKAVFIKDDEIGYKVMNATPSDKLNSYYLPIKVNAYSIDYNKTFDLDDCVYIMNNELQKPTSSSIALFSKRLYETERTIDVNLHAQRTPILIEGNKNTMLTLKNAYMQFDGNVPVIYGNKEFNLDSKLNVLNTNAPFVIDKLENYKHELQNDCMTFLGINNANTQKRERLITDEVNANNDLINYYLNCFYKTRKQACDLINKKYDLNIRLVLNKEMIELLNTTKNDIIDLEVQDYEGGEE
jgi:hypothetical protein